MKTIIVTGALIICGVTLATEDAFTLKERISAWKADTGGYITKADPANGKVAIVNSQSRVDETTLNITARYYREYASKMPFIVVSKSDLLTKFSVEVVHDSDKMHSLTLYPDERRAIVNVAMLVGDNPSKEKLAMRTRQEVSRAIAFLVGGGSQYPGTLAGSITRIQDLDRFNNDEMPPDVFMRIETNLKEAGVRPIYRATYRQACEEGWAPEPTNELQQAIWKQVHQIPDKPITIEYDPKRDK